MLDKITFVNGAGNGDVFVSKEYLKWVINNVPAKKYCISHHHGPKIHQDIENLEMVGFTPDSDLGIGPWKLKDNCLYINTWYACDTHKYQSNGTTIQSIHNLFKLCLKSFINVDLVGEEKDFIPKIDFSKFNIDIAKRFLNERHPKKRVFIANNPAVSGQSINFNMDTPTYKLSVICPDVDFYLTGKNIHTVTGLSPNLFYTQDIHKQFGKDLNENAFIASHCDIIIGRGSGAYTFCFCENVIKNKNIFLAFTNSHFAADFGLGQVYKDKFYIIRQQDENNFIKVVLEAIQK